MYVLVHGEFREEAGIYFENMFETSQKSCLPSERSAFNSAQPGVASLTEEQEAENSRLAAIYEIQDVQTPWH